MTRRAFDWYPTPAWMTRALLAREQLRGPVLEPCAGDGAIADVIRRQTRCAVLTNDLDKRRRTKAHLDITTAAAWARFDRWSWRDIVTNFPYDNAQDIVPLAHQLMRRRGGILATILRITWPEPTRLRSDWLGAFPPHRMYVLPRHSFRGNRKTDSAPSAWFIWDGSRNPRRDIQVVTRAERDHWRTRDV